MKTWSEFRNQINEGNPLARDLTHREMGLHKLVISAERAHLSPAENRLRTEQMKRDIKRSGHSFVPAKGKWEGQMEDSFVIHAKSPSEEHAEELLKLGRELSDKFDQDAFVLRRPNGSATVHERDGSQWELDSTRYNRDNIGETQYRPRKPEHKRPKMALVRELG